MVHIQTSACLVAISRISESGEGAEINFVCTVQARRFALALSIWLAFARAVRVPRRAGLDRQVIDRLPIFLQHGLIESIGVREKRYRLSAPNANVNRSLATATWS